MKHNRKLLLLTILLALAFAVTACGSPDSSPLPQQTPNEIAESQTAEGQEQTEAEQKTESTEQNNAAEAETENSSSQAAQEEGSEITEQDIAQTAFDAAAAVTVETVSNGVKYTFNTMPQTAQDIQALVDHFGLKQQHNTTAFFMASYVKYAEDAQEGLAMIDVLKGPQPLSDAEKAFIKERLSDKKYLPKSYFEGAVPENNYEPDSPWTIVVSNEAVSAPEGYSYTTVSSGGADSPRRVCMRIKNDSHYLWEYNGVLLGIRLPAEEDPWL